jgi:hypothetical protein
MLRKEQAVNKKFEAEGKAGEDCIDLRSEYMVKSIKGFGG